jgi:hypothetical protein
VEEAAERGLGTAEGDKSAYRQLKNDYQHASGLVNMGTDEAARVMREGNVFDGAMSGAMNGLLYGGAGGFVAGAAMGGARKVMSQHGRRLWAEMLDSASKKNVIGRMAEFIEGEIATATSSFINGGEFTARRFGTLAGLKSLEPDDSKKTAQEKYTQRSEMVRSAMVDPELTKAKLHEQYHFLPPESQELAAIKTLTVLQYLYGKLPVEVKTELLTPFLQQRSSITDSEAAKFNRTYEAALNPLSVLQAMTAQRLAPEQAAAMKANHPKFHQKVQAHLMMDLSKLKAPISHAKKAQIKTLFDVTPSVEFTTDFQRRIRGTHIPVTPGGAMPRKPGAKLSATAANNIGGRTLTGFQSVERGR